MGAKVAICDLGCSMLALPGNRAQRILNPSVDDLFLCTPAYRAPNLCLGDQRFEADVDMWSLGCLAVELWLGCGKMLFATEESDESRNVSVGRAILGRIFELLGTPPQNSPVRRWMESLPFFNKFYGSRGTHLPQVPLQSWPPVCLHGCPELLADFVRLTLVWRGEDRITAARAKTHPFLETPALSVGVALAPGDKGVGSICVGELAPELLQYLQACPSWPALVASSAASRFVATSSSVHSDEAVLGFKSEHAGIIDDENPPVCLSLNKDRNLTLISSKRVACFLRVVRATWKPWLDELTARVREEIRQSGLPEELLKANRNVFMTESFADNALAHATVQVLEAGTARSDGWHSDGGCSLLHAGLTLFGTRTLEVQVLGESCSAPPPSTAAASWFLLRR